MAGRSAGPGMYDSAFFLPQMQQRGLAQMLQFDPTGAGYDYTTARQFGMGPTGTGENQGHWGSVAPVSPEQQKQYGLPSNAYMVLKGAQHPTFHKAVAGEQERGYQVVKIGDRYFSVPTPPRIGSR